MILVAKDSFACEVDGRPLMILKGKTFRSGHPLTEAYPLMFEEQVPDFEWGDHTDSAPVEEATANPGEERPPVKRGPGRPRGSTTRKAR